ncbi:fungal specific transcription factor domain-containing protein [Aspergillus stella-maris]|uniref:fungal specific transcription factor domain-containing protein n=1 Tax=Aspergillus stella-maris TaxID=1810926 RepID=UPI003CCE3DAA
MKCDRQEPCSNCVRRQRVEFCLKPSNNEEALCEAPDAHSGQEPDATQTRQSRPSVDDFQYRWAAPLNAENHSTRQEQPHGQYELSPRHVPSQPTTAEQEYPGVSNSTPVHHNQGHPNNLNGFAFFVPSAPPQTVQDPSSVPSGSTTAPWPNNATQPGVNAGDEGGSHGTLMLGRGGRSKYLGPAAGSEWLKDSETQVVPDSPSFTRAPSPVHHQPSFPLQSNHLDFGAAPIAFPFNGSAARISTRDLVSHLPPREEAWTLAESYYRYCAWHHDVAPKAAFQRTFDRVYTLSEGGSLSPRVNPQEIALVFIILAQGTMFNIEMPYYDPSAEEWLHLSERALVEGSFLSHNMVAGLQTLHLMAHLHLQLDKGSRGDTAWPLWGLVMRLIQAMGMHRDGACWNLPQDVVEERRKVFWECNAADNFQAHCFSRPSAINPEHCDVAFPSEPANSTGEKSYSILRFELSQLSSEILNMAMKVRKPPYSHVIDLDLRLCEFERNLPFSFRCRAALLAMPSRYPQFQTAIEASPDPSRRSMTKSFQQSNLALNICETIINLHRPYYAKALYEDIDDRLKSVYAPSFMTVIERCAMILAIVNDIHCRFPAVGTRQWNFWYHVFGSALCLGTLVLRDPGNPMATFVLAQLDLAIDLFTSLIQNGANTPRYCRNLQWLNKLRSKVSSKISLASTPAGQQPSTTINQREPGSSHDHVTTSERPGTGQRQQEAPREHSEDEDEDVELLGWRTRLIERAGPGQDRHKIRTISIAATTPNGTHVANAAAYQSPGQIPSRFGLPLDSANALGGLSLRNANPDLAMPGASFPWVTPDSTDGFLNDFWDPMLLQDIFNPTQE